jgi:hypothetical protein
VCTWRAKNVRWVEHLAQAEEHSAAAGVDRMHSGQSEEDDFIASLSPERRQSLLHLDDDDLHVQVGSFAHAPLLP